MKGQSICSDPSFFRKASRRQRRTRTTAHHAAPVEISVVLPCFNELPNLPELRRRLLSVLEATGRSFEVLFVDDAPAADPPLNHPVRRSSS